MQCRDDGLLDLDDPIATHLPVPAHGRYGGTDTPPALAVAAVSSSGTAVATGELVHTLLATDAAEFPPEIEPWVPGERLRLERDPRTGVVVGLRWATYRFTRVQETFDRWRPGEP